MTNPVEPTDRLNNNTAAPEILSAPDMIFSACSTENGISLAFHRHLYDSTFFSVLF